VDTFIASSRQRPRPVVAIQSAGKARSGNRFDVDDEVHRMMGQPVCPPVRLFS
jgi:hypothetical protein